MRKNENTEHIEGRVYDHELVVKTVQNQQSPNYGKQFIAGKLAVAVDEEGINVIETHYTYVTETTKAGGKNKTFGVLKKIIDEGKIWITVGKDEAFKVKIDTALDLNDFYSNSDDQLVSVKTNEGGFVDFVSELKPEAERNAFKVDMLITNVTHIDADESKGILEPYASVRGAIFNFRNAILPMDFVIKNEAGMQYFEDLDASPANPVYTKVWGKINSITTKVPKHEESAFGEAAVSFVERKVKEWVITGTAKVPYDFGDEAVMTVDEVTKALQDREVYLAEKKRQNDEYKAQKAAASAAPVAPASAFPTAGVAPVINRTGFNF